MKKIIRYLILITFALITHNYIWSNLSFSNFPADLLKVALILTLFELILKPILKILLLPINILTLGLIRFVIDTLGLYLAVYLLADFKINTFSSSSFNFFGLTLPQFSFQGFQGYLLTAVSLGIIFNLYYSFTKKS